MHAGADKKKKGMCVCVCVWDQTCGEHQKYGKKLGMCLKAVVFQHAFIEDEVKEKTSRWFVMPKS